MPAGKYPLKILPVGINYSSFKRFGKNLFVNLGNIFTASDFDKTLSDGTWNQVFNNKLQQELSPLVFEIEKKDKKKQQELLEIDPSLLTKVLLAIPAVIGLLIHAPLYLPINFGYIKNITTPGMWMLCKSFYRFLFIHFIFYSWLFYFFLL
jgi:hypothetical protein